MNNKESYRAIDRFYVPEWLTGQIQVANFTLVDHMKWLLKQDGRFNEVFNVERKEIEQLQLNQSSLRNLLRAPFLMVEPTLQTVEDWRCFVDNTATTVAVDVLRRKTPELDSLMAYAVNQQNSTFVSLVTQVLNVSVMGAPLLGISTEVAKYLMSVPHHKLHVAIGRMKELPLFRWRFNSPAFWWEFAGSTLTDETIAHLIMLTSPSRVGELPYAAHWGDLRLGRVKNEAYASALMAYGLRASTASNLFGMNQHSMRIRYSEIHGKSSPCGNTATSLTWFVETPVHRLHATVYAWLYRSATAMGANPAEALIATNDIYDRLFGGNRVIMPDRGWNLIRSMAADARLTIAPCRTCSTHYVVSNNDTKIEMHSRFTCPACNQQLGMKKRAARRPNRDA
ncbi:FlhC family transcriptional regulator [Paraburkholderia sp. SARCC-3016]|uniref:FlhC family transcriptional regulator n=1 Tax=Paraburkholderia sp. SARCC-3016 TaxID=3058611 RepID=UPI00280A0FA5|nr:FlhC family transcriptional regulator [Paraburkholderia sp. SARCC-3016]MDQ7979986.1 FlhC family transcriptional regulator [Paraburkholderia sp. SARCC-3016]